MPNTIQSFIQATGLIPPKDIPAGRIIAFPGLNKPPHNKAARCLLFPDQRGGWVMDYSTGLFEVWQAERGQSYTKQERQDIMEQCERDRLARGHETAKTQQQTAQKARKIWKRAILCRCRQICTAIERK